MGVEVPGDVELLVSVTNFVGEVVVDGLWGRMVDAGDMAMVRVEDRVLFGRELFEVGLVAALEEAVSLGPGYLAADAARWLLSLKDSVE